MRRTLSAAVVIGVAVLAPGGASAASKELHLYNWSNYMPPDLLKRFEAETGIHVTMDTYDSNETLIAKLEAGGSGYDVVVPTGSFVPNLIKEGLLQKIDVDQLPNFKNVHAPFDKPVFDPERAYTAPYMWGITGIAYDTTKVKGGTIEDSWKELFEPRPDFVGNIGMLKDPGEVIGAASYYLGFPYCMTDPKQGQQVLDLLLKQKQAVKVYDAEGTVDRVAGGEVTMELMWNGSFHRAHKKLANVAYVFPKEGMEFWPDNLAIPKGAPNVDNAKTFLNWMMEPKNAAEVSNFTGYNNAITGSEQYLTPELRDDPTINVSKEHQALFREDEACPKPALDLRDKIWTRLLR